MGFLELPVELRLKIYGYVFTGPKGVAWQPRPRREQWKGRQPTKIDKAILPSPAGPFWSLLLANRLIHNEAFNLIYTHHHIRFNTHKDLRNFVIRQPQDIRRAVRGAICFIDEGDNVFTSASLISLFKFLLSVTHLDIRTTPGSPRDHAVYTDMSFCWLGHVLPRLRTLTLQEPRELKDLIDAWRKDEDLPRRLAENYRGLTTKFSWLCTGEDPAEVENEATRLLKGVSCVCGRCSVREFAPLWWEGLLRW